MKSRMNVLFVTHHYLHGNGGGIYASRAYINALAEISDKITLLYPMKEGLEIEDISDKVESIPIYNNKSKALKAIDMLLGRIHRYFNCFEEHLKHDNYDYIVFDNSKVSYRLIDVAHKYGCKVITIHHNYEYEYNCDNLSGITKLLMLYWVKKFEKQAVIKSDLNLTLTQQDKILLTTNYSKGKNCNIDILGCFEFKRRNPILLKKKDNRYRFIITGSLGDVQTEQSLIPWLIEYYPILKQIIPEAILTIAGRNPSDKLIKLCKNVGVDLIASPRDMQPLLDNADFFICPTFLGGGLKLRLMDALKNGLPIIAHEISARGYDIFVEKGYLLAYNDVISFRKCLDIVCNSTFVMQDIQNLYESSFTFNTGVERFKQFLMQK